MYMKGDFLYHPVLTDRHILATPVGHSSDAVSTMIAGIVIRGAPGCGLTMEEIAGQLTRCYWRHPATELSVKSSLEQVAPCGMTHPDAANYLFSCGSFQDYPWDSVLDPDECDDEKLQAHP